MKPLRYGPSRRSHSVKCLLVLIWCTSHTLDVPIMSSPSQTDLRGAAASVIEILKGIPEFGEARIAVIGGLALWKYVPTGRTTEDVDFIINIDSAPASVKSKLLALPNTPFHEQAQFFFLRTPSGKNIQIDITPIWQSPYMPPAAKKLLDIPKGAVPYIAAIDLIVFKINSCGLRAQGSKKRRDATDAETLLEKVIQSAPLSLSPQQKSIVEPCLADMVAHGSHAEEWWRTYLGLPAPPAPAPPAPAPTATQSPATKPPRSKPPRSKPSGSKPSRSKPAGTK